VDLIIVATVTPDMFFPSTACLVQNEIGAKNAWGFDMLAGCSGFLFALVNAARMIESGSTNKVLVIGSDVISSVVDYTDRNTCVLFGDAAGAALLDVCNEPGHGFLDFIVHIDGSGADYLCMKGGGSRRPATHETVDNKEHFIFQDGRNVFKSAVTEMARVSGEIIERNGLAGPDISLFIPHQANHRIVDAAAKRMGIDHTKVIINLGDYGNTVAASIPLALYEAVVEKKYEVKKGDHLVMAAFGAGYTWGSALLRWWEE
jgi:3-oxoacyl-[acyl-carrier-protein] synthase-3